MNGRKVLGLPKDVNKPIGLPLCSAKAEELIEDDAPAHHGKEEKQIENPLDHRSRVEHHIDNTVLLQKSLQPDSRMPDEKLYVLNGFITLLPPQLSPTQGEESYVFASTQIKSLFPPGGKGLGRGEVMK